MTPRVLALIALAGGLLATATPAQPPTAPPPRLAPATDFPLPPGVFARLGTPQFRHPHVVAHTAFSADGSVLASACYGSVFLWETRTGKLLRRIDRPGVPFDRLAFTPDGQTLYAVAAPVLGECDLYSFDPTTGRELCKVTFPKLRYFGLAEFSVDTSRLVVADWQRSKTVVIHPASGTEKCTINGEWLGGALSHDGKRLVVPTHNRGVHVYDTTTGEKTAQISIKDQLPDYVLESPDGKYLVLSGGGVILWDLAAGAPVWGGGSNFLRGRPSFSPDGSRIILADYGVTVIDTASGKNPVRIAWHDRATHVRFSPDGKAVAVASADGTISLWDAATGKLLPQSPDPPVAVTKIRFTPDGTQLHGYGSTGWMRWDLTAAAPTRPTSLVQLEVLSPDGRIGLRYDRHYFLEFMNPTTGDPIRGFNPSEKYKQETTRGFFSDDGQWYIAARLDPANQHAATRGIRVWDTSTGKLAGEWTPDVSAGPLAVAPDGSVLFWSWEKGGPPFKRITGLWEPGTNRVRWWIGQGPRVETFAFAAGNTRLVRREIPPPPYRGESMPLPRPEPTSHPFTILDALHGGELARLIGPAMKPDPSIFLAARYLSFPDPWAVTPDGRTLVVGGYEGVVHLWEVATDRERARVAVGGPVQDLAVSPDGKVLAVATPIAPVYLWDVYGTHAGVPKPGAAELAKAWDDLASADAAAGFRAVKALVADGNESLPVLKARMAAVRFPTAEAIQKLIAALDSDDFATREKATRELAAIARLAEPQLRAAVKNPSSLEVRMRAERILNAATRPDGEELRAIRAVEVAEVIGTADAAKLLAAWAAGDGVLAREAKAAMGRVKK